ncbi:hypothetical protein [Clostridium botulinum]|uniref:hypothetical protein n=1 Tax=Clostridium botulinum TaxID=1491 RepID=UPI001C9AA5EE|nr:hypothetical protein [Clostridium botulinum]MBY6838777.1 hypothetical protein [Clostridium botulinum]
MFNIELIRKIFIYEKIYRKFEMGDFKFLLKLDDKYINQKYFKEWIDNNGLIDELKDWLTTYKLEKTFKEVYVKDKTDVENLVDSLFESGLCKDRERLLNEYFEKRKKENILD